MLSLATLPTLTLWVTVRTAQKLLTEVGQQCEELFRGDRLPPIYFTTTPDLATTCSPTSSQISASDQASSSGQP